MRARNQILLLLGMFDVRVRYTKNQSERENVDVFCLGFKKVIYLGFGKGDTQKKKKKYVEKEERRDLIAHTSLSKTPKNIHTPL